MYYVNNERIEILDSKDFGLTTRTVVGRINNNSVILIKDRKSRIIMKDGRQILEQLDTIKSNSKIENIALATNAPICGKTTKLLAENNVEIHQLTK